LSPVVLSFLAYVVWASVVGYAGGGGGAAAALWARAG
jgi:hypothetical protein